MSKVVLPRRREVPQPFFRTPMGVRLILYVIVFIGAASAMFKGVGPSKKAREEAAAGLQVPLTTPPRQFASAEVLHQLRGVDDLSREPHAGAIQAALAFLAQPGPDSQPAARDWTALAAGESIAYPAEFRGGLVRARGTFMGVETRGPHGSITPEFTYRGYLGVEPNSRQPIMLTFESAVPPVAFERNDQIEVEGVFVQVAQYEDKKGRLRATPFLVTSGPRRVETPTSTGFFEQRFYLIILVLVILVLVTTFFVFRKSRTPAAPARHSVRPPGPGR